jgi:hypothetical protein
MKTKLDWKKAAGVPTVPNVPAYEAETKDGKYRVAPWKHRDGYVRFEAFFIPNGAKSMADVRDIAGSAEHKVTTVLKTIDEAKSAAESDFAKD